VIRTGRALALGLALLAVDLAGCGYSFRGNLPDHIKTVAVPVFTNKTAEPAVATFLTSAVVEALSSNGRLRVVKSEDADAILDGEVVGYNVQSIAFDNQANVRQYRLVVTMNLRLRDVRRSSILFEQQGLKEKADFISKHRFLIVKRFEKLTSPGWQNLGQMFQYLPDLRRLWHFCGEV